MSKLRLGLGPLQLSPARSRGGGAPAFNPAADPLASCFIDGFCAASLFDDGAGTYTGVLNDAPAPTVGSWRIQSVTDRVGGFIFTAPSVAERVTWNHVTKRFGNDGTRRLKITTGQPQGIFPSPDFTVFMDLIRTSTATGKWYWEFGPNNGTQRSNLTYNSGTTLVFEPRSFNGGGQTNELTDTAFPLDTRVLMEGWVSGLSSRLLRDATLVQSKADNDSGFAPNDSGIGIFGRNPTSAGNYLIGTSAGIWMFEGGVSTDFEVAFRAWVSGSFP